MKKKVCKEKECDKPRYGNTSRCRTDYFAHQKEKKAKALARKKTTKKYILSEKQRLRKKLWILCKKVIRAKYGNTCFTCDAQNLVGSNWHTAHFIPSSTCGLNLRYDLRNLRSGCYHCNINLGGNGAIYYTKLVEAEGQEYVDQIFKDKNVYVEESNGWYEEKIRAYKEILGGLEANQGSGELL